MTLAITGATGHVGALVAMLSRDQHPRLIVRDLARAPEGFEARVASYGDATASRAALEDIDVLFMVSGAESATRRAEHRTFISAAAAAGVSHIVYTSFFGASPDSIFTLGRDHADTETAIRDSGMAFTILRDNFYSDLLPFFADAGGVIRGPAAEGRVSAVARADVADVAAAVLHDPSSHAGATYELTGPEALSLGQIAERAGIALGRTLTYVNETLEEAYASRAHFGAAPWQVDAWVSTYTAIAGGEVERISADVERVTGRPARNLEDALVAK